MQHHQPVHAGRFFTSLPFAGLLLALLVLRVTNTSAALLADATLQPCVGTTDDPSEPTHCATKLVVKFTVTEDDPSAFGGSSGSTVITLIKDEAFVRPILHGTILPRDVASARISGLHVGVDRSAASNLYPVDYERQFSANMKEYIATGGSPFLGCQARQLVCPPYVNVSGAIVGASDGMCCDCTIFGKDGKGRVSRKCRTALSTNVCLEMSQLSYSGFSVQSGQLSFNANVTITGMGLRSIGGTSEGYDDSAAVESDGLCFSLTETYPSSTVSNAIMGDSDVLTSTTMSLERVAVWDFDEPRDVPNFTSLTLAIPYSPSFDERVRRWREEWMLIEPSLITLDGSECDKVGVSQWRFYQMNDVQCGKAAGTCLQNQIDDLRAADLLRIDQNKTPLYMLRDTGRFDFRACVFHGVHVPQCLWDLLGIPVSMEFTWIMDAAGLDFVIEPSTGCFVEEASSDVSAASGEDRLGSFLESSARKVDAAACPTLPVIEGPSPSWWSIATAVRNTGVHASIFYVSAADCSVLVHSATPTAPDVRDANVSCSLRLDVHGGGHDVPVVLQVQVGEALVNTQVSCTVVLRDAVNATLDTRYATWLLVGTGEFSDDSSSSGGDGEKSKRTSSDACRECGFGGISCLFKHDCGGEIFGWLAIVVAIFTVLWCLVYWRARIFAYLPWLSFLGVLCYCCPDEDSDDDVDWDIELSSAAGEAAGCNSTGLAAVGGTVTEFIKC